MPEASRVTAGSTIQINDLNQLIDLLEGGSSMTGAFNLVSTSGEDFIIKLADAAGARSILIKDSSGATVASINSNGEATFVSSTSSGALILPKSTSPGDTTEASIQWDTNDDRLVIGDGSTTKTFYPGLGAGLSPVTYKYKTADQNFTTTTFADVTATSGNLAFDVAASTGYIIEYDLYVTAVGTVGSGGLKLALTFPSSPTYAQVYYDMAWSALDSSNLALGAGRLTAAATPTSGNAYLSQSAVNNGGTPGITTGWYRNKVVFLNGANAGTVTLQAAQNTAAGTTTIGEAFASCIVITAA